MSHSTNAVVQTLGGSSSALGGAMAAAGGIAIAGAAIYLAARQMHGDYQLAYAAYEERHLRDTILNAQSNAAFALAQQRAREMHLPLSEKAHEDPNTAFLLGGLGRLKTKISGLGPDGTGPSAGAALLAQVDALLAAVAQGEATAQYGAYEKLTESVSELAAQWRTKSAAATEKQALAAQLFAEEMEALRDDIALSVLAENRHRQTRQVLIARLDEMDTLAAGQPSVALQSLRFLRERFRSEVRSATEKANQDRKNALRVRELVGQISAHAQAVLRQEYLPEQRAAAEVLLKRVSAQVAASPVELAAIEALAEEAKALFEATEQALDERANEEYIQDQVAQVLGTLGYRVSHATNGQDESKMVAILDSGVGVQLNIDGQGNLSGEMVAFSESTAMADAYSEEKVCDLMDAIFDGLRRRNHVVKEKKRRTFKPGSHRIEVVKLPETTAATAAAREQKAMQLPASQ